MAPSTLLLASSVVLVAGVAARPGLHLERISQTYVPFKFSGSERSYCYDAGVSEQIAYHAATQQVILAGSEFIQLFSITDVNSPVLDEALAVDTAPTDVEVCGHLVAASFENADAVTLPGFVTIYTTVSGSMDELGKVETGALPDMLVWTSDCKKILTADEGEAGTDADGNFLNPEGSVTIIDVEEVIAGNTGSATKTAGFTQFNARADGLVEEGVRWVWRGETLEAGEAPTQTFSMDLEPEYIALSKDDKKAYVVLQENNAIAVVDVDSATVEAIRPLGYKAWADIEKPMDPRKKKGIDLQPWDLYGMFQPDAITSFEVDGQLYLAIANEGDAKEYTKDDQHLTNEFLEEADAEDVADRLTHPDADVFFAEPDATYKDDLTLKEALEKDGPLDGLTVSVIDGGARNAAGGEVSSFDKVVTYGGRSFSILKVNADGTLEMIFDSGSALEERHATHFPTLWNMDAPDGWCPEAGDAEGFSKVPGGLDLLEYLADAEGVKEAFEALAPDGEEVPEFIVDGLADVTDNRSDNKGPETEAIKVVDFMGAKILFAANERTSTIFMYDVTEPSKPVYLDAVYGGDLSSKKTFLQMYLDKELGDLDPEGIDFVLPENSPTGSALLIVAGSLSGTFSIYELKDGDMDMATDGPNVPCAAAFAGGSVAGSLSTTGIVLSDVDPMGNLPSSQPPTFEQYAPMPGTFAVSAMSAQRSNPTLSVPTSLKGQILAGVDCHGRSNSEVCFDYPGLFSGFTGPFMMGEEVMFMGMTDRGPNQKCSDLDDGGFYVESDILDGTSPKGFPTADYAPSFTFLAMDDSNQLKLRYTCPLKGANGNRLAGLSAPTVDSPNSQNCAQELAADANGVDPEEIQFIGDSGWCLVVEEYYPSIMLVKCGPMADSCGEVHTRLVPKGITIHDPAYIVEDVLPAELAYRKANRGFESAAVSIDGSKAYVFVQSPLVDPDFDSSNTTALRVIELRLRLDGTAVPAVEVAGQFVYAVDPYWMWDSANSMSKVLVSAAAWLGDGKVLLLERASGQVKLYALDFTGATNLFTESDSDRHVLLPERDMMGDERADWLTVVSKELVMDSAAVAGWTTDINGKQEGLAILNSCVVALAEDNDFGLEGNDQSDVTLIQLETCLEVYSDSPFGSPVCAPDGGDIMYDNLGGYGGYGMYV